MKPIQHIFERQSELMKTYGHLRSSILGEHYGIPFSCSQVPSGIDWPANQLHIRELVGYINEELFESTGEFPGSPEHKEELIDVLHFYVELMIFSGLDYENLHLFLRSTLPGDNDLIEILWPNGSGVARTEYHRVGQVMAGLGAATHCLKNKPWKQSRTPTNVVNYYQALVNSFREFLGLLSSHLSWDEVYDQYMAKATKNKKRQETAY
ncbi:hypothetical protein QJV44_gp43 [Serratia phage vB_SmaS_Tlacuache]|uniref:dUTPase n=1 Tax=Serratia phage vB_SmaS_Tlacuache TaxID=2894809 RepID=A0AAE8YVQ9_9CAUD|nr:hypothetical protein QJV44_gp43 [Serratia phage vB_SmaS_Tlacuache]UGO51457.1 hypothetical protein TLACUACHE_43 [Serratia phage vB_SmaS_Tlacuache]